MSSTGQKVIGGVLVALVVTCAGLVWHIRNLQAELTESQRAYATAQSDLRLAQQHAQATQEALCLRNEQQKEALDVARQREEALRIIPDSWGNTILPDTIAGMFQGDSQDTSSAPGSAQ